MLDWPLINLASHRCYEFWLRATQPGSLKPVFTARLSGIAEETASMIVNTLLLWLLGALFGSMLFFAVTVAPTVFRVLPADQGGAFLRRFFPLYYLWGIVMASLCTLTACFNRE